MTVEPSLARSGYQRFKDDFVILQFTIQMEIFKEAHFKSDVEFTAGYQSSVFETYEQIKR